MTVLNFPTKQDANATKTMEDAELIEACIDGNQRALAEFVDNSVLEFVNRHRDWPRCVLRAERTAEPPR